MKSIPLEHLGRLSHDECTRRLAQLSKGLAHPARVEIVLMLANTLPGNKCVCGDIVNALPLAQSSVSQHLKVLRETGWILGKIEGPRVCYCIVDGIFEYYEMLMKRCLEKHAV
ncbi:ArsR/SmtB family transcription factor [Thermodesulfobacteriota bacterium]